MPTVKSTSGDLPTGLTVDEFLAWADGRPGRYELHAGRFFAMSPERAGHAETKSAVQTELKRAKLLTSIHVSSALRLDPLELDLDVERCFA